MYSILSRQGLELDISFSLPRGPRGEFVISNYDASRVQLNHLVFLESEVYVLGYMRSLICRKYCVMCERCLWVLDYVLRI